MFSTRQGRLLPRLSEPDCQFPMRNHTYWINEAVSTHTLTVTGVEPRTFSIRRWIQT